LSAFEASGEVTASQSVRRRAFIRIHDFSCGPFVVRDEPARLHCGTGEERASQFLRRRATLKPQELITANLIVKTPINC
jgi:hypothetical protein